MNFNWSSLQLFLVAVKFFCPTLYFFPAFCLLDFLQTQIQLFQLFPDLHLTAPILFSFYFRKPVLVSYSQSFLFSFTWKFSRVLHFTFSGKFELVPSLWLLSRSRRETSRLLVLASLSFSQVSKSLLFLSRNQNLQFSTSGENSGFGFLVSPGILSDLSVRNSLL